MVFSRGQAGLKHNSIYALLLVLGWVSPARADSPQAKAPGSVQIWYLSGAGCPDGGSFLQLLRRLGRTGSIAGVGDRVDFVVTLASTETESSGRLERQSNAGTVAIREFASASCAEVADVLALSLDLALKPEESEPAPLTDSGWQPRLGAQLSMETGVAHALLPGAALFVGIGQGAWSARFSLRGAYAEPDAVVPLRIALLTTRLEGCWAWTLGDVALGPCAGVELGTVRAESSGDGGHRDGGFWGGAATHLRASWHVSRLAEIEAQIGALVPFVRYDFEALSGGTVTDSAALGLTAALGGAFRW